MTGRSIRAAVLAGTLSTLMGCDGGGPVRAPPSLFFAGLPVSGNLADAQRAGFTDCVDLDAVHIRCRHHGVMVEDAGPYDAAVDLTGRHGEGGFDQVTLWNDNDNDAVFRVANALERAGWLKCLTGNGRAGDQAIYVDQGSPAWASMDISYWGKRRIRLIPEWNRRERRCLPM